MKVNLISYTGHGNPDPDYAARLLVYTKNTRLEQGEATRQKIASMSQPELFKELEYIANTLRSSWEFVDYTFEITDVTRAFTHQLVRTRTGSYAQQAQRVVGLADFTAEKPKTIQTEDQHKVWNMTMDMLRKAYAHLSATGVPNQDCRGLLPTNVHTNIIAKFNLRTLADLVGKRDNPRAQGEYEMAAKLMAVKVLRVHPWAYPFLYPDRTATPVLDKLLRKLLGEASPVDHPDLNAAMKEVDKLKRIWG